ncbi:MAG: alpha/beta hydrolase [Desulfobacterales bacterium]|nr:alpha/beta hydrolase [Desulfobacterales bacterium]
MKSNRITLRSDLDIHYYEAGDESAPALVLLHGWPSSALLWREIIPSLAGRFRVLAPDLPGHGQSDKPRHLRYDLDCLRTFILDFLDALDLDKAHLVAHDLGGMAGLSLAVRNPECISKLVVMNTSPYPKWHWQLSMVIGLLKMPVLTPLFLNPFVFKQVLASGVYNTTLLTPERMALFRAFWTGNKESRNAFSKTIAVPPQNMVEPREALQRIDLPCLILWGKQDRYFSFGIARKLHRDIQGSKLVGIDNAGHFLQEEKPEQIASALLDFL